MQSQPPNPRKWKLLEARTPGKGSGRTVCIANQKGGVGKTTTSVNLAAALALRGHRVLVIDIDPQANATTGLGVDYRSLELSTYDLVMGEASLEEVVVETAIRGLHCAPSSVDLAGAEVELAGEMARELKLRLTLENADERYDIVFVDCPPSLGLLTINALAAAHDLIVPVQCEYYALEGLGQLLGNAERVRRALNPDLRIAGFLLTMYDARTNLAEQVADEVREHFGELVFGTIIPRSVRLSEAPSFGEPVLTLDPGARGSVAFRLLAAEVEDRYGLASVPPPPPQAEVPTQAAAGRDNRVNTGPASAPAEPQEKVASPAAPGPGGRGYGAVAPEPSGMERMWPPANPWTESPGEADGGTGTAGGQW